MRKILSVGICGILLLCLGLGGVRVQDLQGQGDDAKAVLASILKTPTTDTSSAIAIIKKVAPEGLRELWRGLSVAGRAADGSGDLQRALLLYACAAETARLAENEMWLGEAELLSGSLLLRTNDYPAAETSLLRAVQLNEKVKSEANLINSLDTLGALYIRLSKYDLAEQVTRRALSYVTASQNRNSIQNQYAEAVASNNLGTIAAWRGSDADAIQHLERAVGLYGQLDKASGGYRPAMLDSQIGLGKVYYNLGDYRKALRIYGDVLVAAERDGYRNLQHAVLNDLGMLYLDQADFGAATEYFRRSLKIATDTGDREAGITARLNLGLANERQGKYEQAGELFKECLQQAEQLAAPKFVIPALEGLATVYQRKGQNGLALENYDRALEVATKLGDRLRQSELAWRKAGVLYGTGNFEQSAKLSAWAGELAEEIHESNYSYLALTLTGKSHLALGQIEAARATLQNAILKLEQIRSQVGGQEQQRAFFFGRKIEPYYLMVDLLVRQNRPEEALEVAEQARSRSLLDLIGNPRSDPAKSMSPAEKDEEQKLSGQLATLNSQLYRMYQQNEPDRNRINELRTRLERARVDYDAFLDRLAVNHPELGVERGRAAPYSVRDTKTVLNSPDAAVVEFVVLDDKICLFVLTLDDAGNVVISAHQVTVPKKKLTDAVQQFRDRITNNSLGIDKPATELFQLLLGHSVATIKDRKTLIFVPDDVLWEVPFQALKDGAGRYLIENHTIFYAPSLTALREMKHRQSVGRTAPAMPVAGTDSGKDAAPMLLAFGNPALSSTTVANVRALDRDVRLGPLPAAKREVETIGNLYGASRSAVFVGDPGYGRPCESRNGTIPDLAFCHSRYPGRNESALLARGAIAIHGEFERGWIAGSPRNHEDGSERRPGGSLRLRNRARPDQQRRGCHRYELGPVCRRRPDQHGLSMERGIQQHRKADDRFPPCPALPQQKLRPRARLR